MKFPFLKKSQPKNEDNGIYLALDIGTEFVKAVIFEIDKVTLKINVKGYAKSKQHSNAMQGAMIVNLENVINACDRAIGSALVSADKTANRNRKPDAEMYNTPIPTRVVMGIAGELVKGITIMAEYTREDPDTKIDEEEMNEVIAHVKEQAFADALIDIAEDLGVSPEAIVELNSKVNATYIDGVKVDDPHGFTGKDVTYRVFSTFAPSMHINSLKEIAASLGLSILSIEVEPYAVARAIKGGRKNDFSGIFIDIGGGTTDIAVVDQGAIIGTRMFAYGGRVFTKRIANDFKLELHAAEEMKLDYANGKLTQKLEADVKKAIGKDMMVWAEAVELGLSELDDLDFYPTQIYLCGGGSGLPDIREVMLEYPWLQTLPFMKYPKTSLLFPNQLDSINDETRSIIEPADIAPLALARMALELL